jgi:hypothetical protein
MKETVSFTKLRNIVVKQEERIEKLEAALREIKDQYLTPDTASTIARAALAPEQGKMSRADDPLRHWMPIDLEYALARIEALEAALRNVETQLGLGHLHAALHILRAALAPETKAE